MEACKDTSEAASRIVAKAVSTSACDTSGRASVLRAWWSGRSSNAAVDRSAKLWALIARSSSPCAMSI